MTQQQPHAGVNPNATNGQIWRYNWYMSFYAYLSTHMYMYVCIYYLYISIFVQCIYCIKFAYRAMPHKPKHEFGYKHKNISNVKRRKVNVAWNETKLCTALPQTYAQSVCGDDDNNKRQLSAATIYIATMHICTCKGKHDTPKSMAHGNKEKRRDDKSANWQAGKVCWRFRLCSCYYCCFCCYCRGLSGVAPSVHCDSHAFTCIQWQGMGNG